MEPNEIHVNVRDRDLNLVGKVRTELLDIKAGNVHCGVGNWTIRLPRELEITQALQTSGYGIQVLRKTNTGWDTWFSGPTLAPSHKRTPEDPQGIVTITGVTDDIILWDALAWGDPESDIDNQLTANDIRSGSAESVMKAYVNQNIGPGAPLSRRGTLAQKLLIETDGATGPTVSKSPRFTQLGVLLQEIALYANMGFRVIQEGSNLVFKTYTIQDRSDFIQFNIDNGNLSEETTAIQAPGVTRTIVAGQGEGIERQLIARTTAEASQAEDDWGRVIETWIDQRQTDDIDELNQAGDEPLIASGFTGVSVKAVPTDHIMMKFGVDWGLGDVVGIVVNGSSATSLVTEVSLVASSAGVDIGAALGDVTKFKASTSLQSQINNNANRVANLEKNAEVSLAIKQAFENATPLPTPNRLALRDGSGRAQFATPIANNDAANKGYVDSLVLPPLPAAVTLAGSPTDITATGWAGIPGLGSVSLTVDRPLRVLMIAGGWPHITSGSATLRVTGFTSGDTDYFPPNWGQRMYTDSGAVLAQSITLGLTINAGTTFFGMQAYKTGTGSARVSYPNLDVIPIAWE